jgi:peptidoglycan/LPS O-acetylase OafA/YrhL
MPVSTNGPQKVHRIEYLDSARGLAALAVLAAHHVSTFGFPPQWLGVIETPLRLLWYGEAAVAFFFLLSGFVLALPYLFSEQGVNLPAVAVQRIFRIYPTFLAALALGLLAKWAASQTVEPPVLVRSAWFLPQWAELPSLSSLFEQSLLLVPFESERVLPQSWTLFWELLASLVIPWLAILCRRSPLALLVAGITLAWAPSYHFASVPFIMGIFLASQHSNWKVLWRRWPLVLKALFLVGSLYVTSSKTAMPSANYWLTRIMGNPMMVGIIGLFLVTLASHRVQQVLQLAPFRFLGKISYSLYLMHIMVQLTVVPALLKLTPPVVQSPTALWVVALVSGICLTVLLSWPLHLWVELPANRLGKRLARRVAEMTSRLTAGTGFGSQKLPPVQEVISKVTSPLGVVFPGGDQSRPEF